MNAVDQKHTALHYAAKTTCDVAKVLIQNGAELVNTGMLHAEKEVETRHSPQLGHVDFAKVLLQNGALNSVEQQHFMYYAATDRPCENVKVLC